MMQGNVRHRLRRSAPRSLADATASFLLFVICALQLVSSTKANIANTTQAMGTYNGITSNYGTSSATVPVAAPNAAVILTKIEKDITDTNGNGIRDPGDKVNYTFVVKNTGNVTLNNITLTDAGTIVSGGPISLNPGVVDNTTFTATYTLTASDFVAGIHTNNATISGTAATPAATPVSASSSVITSLSYVAAYSFSKTASLTSSPPKANDIVNYSLTVTNTGTSPLFNVSVSDPLLASNEKIDAHFIALIDSVQNVDAESLTTASLDEVPRHAGIVEAASRAFATLTHAPLLNSELSATRQLVRMSGRSGALTAGEKIGFVYTLSNAGEGPVSNVRITQPDSFVFGSMLSLLNPNETDAASIIFTRDLTDADIAAGTVHSNGYVTWIDRGREKLLQLTQALPLSTIKVYDQFATASISPATVASLNPGQSTVFTGPYVLTQADIDAGTLHNLATATAKDIGGLTITHFATFDLALTQAPAVGVVKSGTLVTALPGEPNVGDTITYKFAVTNLGNVTLNPATVTDVTAGVAISGSPIANLAPGVTNSTSYTASHILTQVDVDAGKFQNQGTVTAKPPLTPAITSLSDPLDPKLHNPTIVPLASKPVIGLVKTVTSVEDVNGNGRNDVGDKVHYLFTVHNLGNVTLHGITVVDKLGVSVVITGSPIVALLAPGATDTSVTGIYVLTQADVDAGSIANTATANGTAPDGTVVSHDSDPAVPTSTAPTVQPLAQVPQLGLFKKQSLWKDLNSDGFVDAGDELDYGFIVQNTGNVTLTNVKVTDLLVGVVLTGPTAGITLAPGAADSTSFTATYIIQAADEAAGFVKNRARGDSTQIGNVLSNSGDLTSSTPGTTDTVVQPAPRIGIRLITPSYVDTNGDGIVDVGDTLTYQIQVKNTGAVSITGISVGDVSTSPLPNVTGGPIATLAPGTTDTTTFAASHVITTADMIAGVYNAQVKASGSVTTPSGAVKVITDLSDPADFSKDAPTPLLIVANPQIAVLKNFTTATYVDVNNNPLPGPQTGAYAVYKVTVQNTGNVDFDIVTLAEKTGFNGVISGSTPFALPVGATDSTHFGVKHLITDAEMLSGHFDNQLTATGTNTAKGLTATDDSDPTSLTGNAKTVVNVTAAPQIAVLKIFDHYEMPLGTTVPSAATGATAVYKVTVKNTGNVDLTTVSIAEKTGYSGTPSPSTPFSLAVGLTDTTHFSVTHGVTNAEMLTGHFDDQLVATGTTASGATTTEDSDSASLTANAPTAVVVSAIKQAALFKKQSKWIDLNNDGIVDAGDELDYTFIVQNTGNVTLTNIVLSDLLLPSTVSGNAPGITLAPGTVDSSTFKASYIIKPADEVAGFVKNRARLDSAEISNVLSNSGDLVSSTPGTTDTTVLTPAPQISALKKFDHYENAAAATVTSPSTGVIAVYAITVTNTGNVNFDNVTIGENGIYTGIVVGSSPWPLAVAATDTTHFTVRHVVTNAEMLAGHFDNQVMATGSNSAKGISATDLSDPSDPTKNAVTVTNVVANPQLTIVKSFKVDDVNGNGANDVGDIIHYSFIVKNTGNVDLTGVYIKDDAAVVPTPVPAIPLGVGAQDTTSFIATHVIIASDVAKGAYPNHATAYGTFDPVKVDGVFADSNTTITLLSFAKPVLTKTAARAQVKRGDVVPYTITGLNLYAIQYQLVDIMPPGFGYAAGSATVNGAAVTPVINGQVLTFNGQTPPVGPSPYAGKLVLNLKLIASATLGGGKFANNARLIEQDNNNVLAVAQAIVEVTPDAVFDCSDIIGRVFDDLNGDGYYQPGEPGLAGVRLATVNGVLITTDDQGRYHVPCAAIPDAAIGSNFLLKLDPRSLPLGYKVTTENPRDVRVTRGKASELNFGATKHRAVKVDVTGKAFAPDSTELTSTWANGVARLCKILGKTNPDLSLVYHQKSETGELAQARVDALETIIRTACDPKPSLKIKTHVEQGQ